MDVVIERCAGLDVHKKTVVTCVRTPRSGRAKERLRKTRTFATTMKGLEAPPPRPRGPERGGGGFER